MGDLFAAFTGMPDNPDHRIVRDNKVIYTAAQQEYRDAIATRIDGGCRRGRSN